jgi:proteasome alpha subunit
MTMPYYASPEQLMRDKSEYARKGIARGRSVAVVTYADGVLFIAENPSSTLHKVGELYDRIGFAAVGRYSEFESLRVAGVRLADVRGYSYNRRDVTGRVIANAYAQTLGEVFTQQLKPFEVELCVQALSAVSPATSAGNGGPTLLSAEQLEVAVLDRRRPKRAFRRITGAALRTLLDRSEGGVPADGEQPHTAAHAPSVPQPGTPAGLGEPSAPDSGGTAGSGGEAPTT